MVKLKRLLENANKDALDLQPWPDYFNSKTREFRTVLKFHDFGTPGSVLEIGCGNAFTSVILSGIGKRVVAFDLPEKNISTHSIGIGSAKELVRRLRAGNVLIVGGSSEKMPFADNSFDLIYSAYALHYMRDKGKALSEMRRSLSEDGTVILVLPNFMGRVLAPFIKMVYIIRRLISDRNITGQSEIASGAAQNKKSIKRVFNAISLKPDGAYRSFNEELLKHMPGAWKALIEKNGFRITGVFSTDLFPFSLINVRLSRNNIIQQAIHKANDALCGLPILRYLGASIVFVLRKDKQCSN